MCTNAHAKGYCDHQRNEQRETRKRGELQKSRWVAMLSCCGQWMGQMIAGERTPGGSGGQRWKKMAAAAAPRVLIFHSCANVWFFHLFY